MGVLVLLLELCGLFELAAFTAIGLEGSIMHFSSFAERHSLGGI